MASIERLEVTDGTVGTMLVATTLALALASATYSVPCLDEHIIPIEADQTPGTQLPTRSTGIAKPAKTAEAAAALLDEWLGESSDYDRETWGEVASELDEHRTSSRKLFG